MHREALLAFEQDPTKIVPAEHRVEVTPLTPGGKVEDITDEPTAENPRVPDAERTVPPMIPEGTETTSCRSLCMTKSCRRSSKTCPLRSEGSSTTRLIAG